MVEEPQHCEECGYDKMELIGDIKNTRSYKCQECFAEKNVFIEIDTCKHEYDDRNYNKCIHCGEESVNYK